MTIISPSKISVAEAYKVFESVLEVNGFTTVPSGTVIKVVPSVQARAKGIDSLCSVLRALCRPGEVETPLVRWLEPTRRGAQLW